MGNTCGHLPYSLRSSNSKDNNGSSTRMESLPDEVLMIILSRFPTLDMMQLSFVCRRWRNILKDPLFRRFHYTFSMSNPNENRVLVLKTELKLHLVDLAKKKGKSPRHIPIDLPRVPGIECYRIIGSCNGLLCLGSTTHKSIIVMNPITHQYVLFSVPLPLVFSWGFGFDQSSKLFKVIVLAQRPDRFDLAASIGDLGSDGSTNWRSIGVTPYCMTRFQEPYSDAATIFHASRIPTCFINGRIHWAYYDDFSIISFDLADEEFRRIRAPDGLVDTSYSYLITIGRCLGIVHYQSFRAGELQIWVMKEYGVESSWVKEINTRPLLPRTLDLDAFKALGSVKNGELVLLNKQGQKPAIVVSSNSRCSKFKRLKEIPTYWKDSIAHTASLNWV